MNVLFRYCLHQWKPCSRYTPHCIRLKQLARCNQTAMYHGATATHVKENMSDVYVVNLRSDTFTMPTTAMKEAMITAPLGDDVYGEDPTVNQLQEDVAKLLGQEASLLVPTGTMGNIAAMLTHSSGKFEEALLGDLSHISLYEVGAISALAGIHSRTVKNNPDGTLDLDDLQSKIRIRSDPHLPWTKLICLENTQNKCGGAVLSLDYIKKVREIADSNDLKLHLDGARVLNAATYLNVAPSEITKHFDSISMCFSKGLSCPVGSILAGSKEFIHRALWARKALGGGMRQAGVIAAPMRVALRDIFPTLKYDHARAHTLAQAVAGLGSEAVMTADVKRTQTNIVMLHCTGNVTAAQVSERLAKVTDEEVKAIGEKIIVKAVPFSSTTVRLVTYHGILDVDVEKAVKKLQYVLIDKSSFS